MYLLPVHTGGYFLITIQLIHSQGEQIGRNFAGWAILLFGQFFEN
jgi:hypothetical protein